MNFGDANRLKISLLVSLLIFRLLNLLHCRASTRGAVPLTAVSSGADLATASGEQTREQWKAMALASGWTPEFQKKKALETAFGSLFIAAGVK